MMQRALRWLLLWVGAIIIELKWLLTTDYTDCSVPWHLFFLLFISWFCFFWVFLVCFRVFFMTNEFVIYWPSPVISPFCHGFWARMWHNKDGGEKKKGRRRWRGSDSSMHSSASIPSAAITPYRLYKHYANVCAAVQCAIMWCWR